MPKSLKYLQWLKKCTCSAVVDTRWLLMCLYPLLCRDGIKLSENDEKFIVENILSYHPEKEKKVAGHDNYITVPSLPFYLSMHQKNQTRNVMKILSLLAG
jgi:hypothetical protein